MVAGLERHGNGASLRVNALCLGVPEAHDFRVGLSGLMVIAAGHDVSVPDEHSPHSGIGAGREPALLRFGDGLAHGLPVKGGQSGRKFFSTHRRVLPDWLRQDGISDPEPAWAKVFP